MERRMNSAARPPVFGRTAAAIAAALTLSNINNCASAQEWEPPDGNWQGNLSVEALFDWEVPVSVVSSGAYLSTWANIPDDYEDKVQSDLADNNPTNTANPYAGVLEGTAFVSYTDGEDDSLSPWEQELEAVSEVSGSGGHIASLGTDALSLQGLSDTVSGYLASGSPPASSISVASFNWGDFLKQSISPEYLDDFGVPDAFDSFAASHPYFSWVADWYEEGVQAACDFLNRPALTRILRSVYSIACVFAFWVLAYMHLVKVLWAPVASVLGALGGTGKGVEP